MRKFTVLLRWLLHLYVLALTPGLIAQTAKAAVPVIHRPTVVMISLHDTLQPVSAATLQAQLLDAAAKHPRAILLSLSTPGGLPASAQMMAKAIAASPVPVLVYVRQPKTHVGGEGLRLLMAGTAAAIHPDAMLVPLQRAEMRAGSASEHDAEIKALDQELRADLQRHGKPPAVLDDLLATHPALDAQEALQAGLVGAVTAKDEDALRLLEASLAGSEAATTTEAAAAGTAGLHAARIVEQPLSTRENMMRALMNPDLTVLLLTLGALLLFLEINTPGTVLPGAAGLLLVLLSSYALLQMPLRWQGVLLLFLSAGLLFAETLSQRGVAYGIGAVVALTLGLRLLVRSPIPELEVDWSTSIGAGLGFGGITAVLVSLGVRARRAKVKIGADAMIGWLAITQTALEPSGEVLVRGELWRARLSEANSTIAAGECVKVQNSDGVTLEVSPLPVTWQAEAEAATLAR